MFIQLCSQSQDSGPDSTGPENILGKANACFTHGDSIPCPPAPSPLSLLLPGLLWGII